MVNSDQTWRKKYLEIFYDIAFLYFAKNWKIYKFIYGASMGSRKWKFNKTDEQIAKFCLKNFYGISVRERGLIKKIRYYLGFKSVFVFDPTFLIEKNYYLKIINNYSDINFINSSYIFTYLFSEEEEIIKFIKDSSIQLNFKIFAVKHFHKDSVKKFLYGIYNCKAVITNSYHGTLFSIIFNKPFITFIYKNGNNERFDTLKEIFNIENRIIEFGKKPNINLLSTPLNIEQNIIDSLKYKSINYLKMNLKNYKNINKIFV